MKERIFDPSNYFLAGRKGEIMKNSPDSDYFFLRKKNCIIYFKPSEFKSCYDNFSKDE